MLRVDYIQLFHKFLHAFDYQVTRNTTRSHPGLCHNRTPPRAATNSPRRTRLKRSLFHLNNTSNNNNNSQQLIGTIQMVNPSNITTVWVIYLILIYFLYIITKQSYTNNVFISILDGLIYIFFTSIYILTWNLICDKQSIFLLKK